MSETPLSDRLAEVRAGIAAGLAEGGLGQAVRIVAVTKTHGPEVVRSALAAGLTLVGENRVQEALEKQADCIDLPVEWHLIGGLQRKKAKQVIGHFALIHSVDRLELAEELYRFLPEGSVQRILVQVNCSGEPQKGGVEPEGLPALLSSLRLLPRLELEGLMTMAALTEDEREQRRTFAQLRTLRDRMITEGHHLPELSMGMSGDFRSAVAEGATLLRLGSVLFGSRE